MTISKCIYKQAEFFVGIIENTISIMKVIASSVIIKVGYGSGIFQIKFERTYLPSSEKQNRLIDKH